MKRFLVSGARDPCANGEYTYVEQGSLSAKFTNESGSVIEIIDRSPFELPPIWSLVNRDGIVMFGADAETDTKKNNSVPPMNGWFEIGGLYPPMLFDLDQGEIPQQLFGYLKEENGGSPVTLYLLRMEDKMEVEVMDYGCTVRALRVKNKQGLMQDVVVGLDSLQDYLTRSRFFGCIAGRYANRICDGKFTLKQPDSTEEYTLAVNNGKNHLHGGIKGFNRKIWIAKMNSSTSLSLNYVSKDGEEGYPCEVINDVTISIEKQQPSGELGLRLDYKSKNNDIEKQRKTVLNLTNHSYFCLSGDFDTNGITRRSHHFTMANTCYFTPTDSTSIPTGKYESVKGTPFDFTGDGSLMTDERLNDSSNEQIRFGNGIDHNFVIERGDEKEPSMLECVRVECEESGIKMTCLTDQPGFQLYTANFLDRQLYDGKGKRYGKRGSFCIETQHFPDSPNQPDFPSTELCVGKPFTSSTVYSFGLLA